MTFCFNSMRKKLWTILTECHFIASVVSRIDGFLVSLTSRMKLRSFAVSVTALKGGASGVVHSSHPELFIPPGGFVVSLASGEKLQTFTVSVTAR